MTAEMTAEAAAALRAPFSRKEIGKLPRITCKDCSNRHCGTHKKVKCKDCGNYMTTAHLHLDYVGHATVTSRLHSVDPAWSWEPLAFAENGLPLTDSLGGLWIKLTILGVTKLGYGDSGTKRGADAVKETIGDAIRNAAMRFGVGVDMWGAKGEPRHDDDSEDDDAGRIIGAPPKAITKEQLDEIRELWDQLGFSGEANYDQRMKLTKDLLKIQNIESTSDLLEAEAHQLIKVLRRRVAETKRKPKAEASAVTE